MSHNFVLYKKNRKPSAWLYYLKAIGIGPSAKGLTAMALYSFRVSMEPNKFHSIGQNFS